MLRTLLVPAALALTAVAWTLGAQSPATATLAPTGTLRAVFLGTNPVHARVDPRTGIPDGPVPDLVRELARTLSVPHTIEAAPNAAGVIKRLTDQTADIGFLAYDEARAREVEFGPAFVIMFNSYLVRADSTLQRSSDVDRPGLKVGAVKGQTQQLFVSSHLERATVKVFEAMPTGAELEEIFARGEVDAFAVNRQRALEAEAASRTLRALPDSFSEVEQCFVVRKGERSKLEHLERFVDNVRTSGFIKRSIERARLAGVDVAPGPKGSVHR
jgi:polar amino acid transport system substrate-binding protein